MKAVRFPLFTHRFVLTGLNLERFMNTMQKAEVPLLSVRRKDHRTLECTCYSSDLPQIRAIAAEKGWRIQREEAAQLSALLLSLLRRPGILVGTVLAVATVMVLSQFIWRIDIHDAGAYRADIAAYLEDEGCRPGLPRTQVDAQALERQLTYRYPEIAWFHVYVSNVSLVVDVSMGVPMPDLPSAEPADVVAQRGGIVDSVRVYAGTALVKAGDVVQKGQVLIRGVERAADEQLTPVHASGVVMARCWKSLTVQMPLYEIQSEETGHEITRTQLSTPWLSWPESLDSPEFLAYNTYVSTVPVVGSFFPVLRKTITQREVSMHYAPRAVEEVRREAETAALQRLKSALYGYEIIDKWVDYCMIEGDALAATATAEWLMDIGGSSPP